MDDHTILASDSSFGTISVCPGGVVHVHLPHVSLKFVPDDFIKFSDLVGKARLNFQKGPERGGGKPRLHLVPSESEDNGSSDPDPET